MNGKQWVIALVHWMNWRKNFAAVLAVLISLSFLSASGYGDEPKSVYLQGEGDTKRIALTFDDGPHPKYTSEILDLLSEYNIKATFFVIGTNAESYPELLRREIDEGHEIGNHTYTHTRISSIGDEELCKEVRACEQAINGLDYSPYLFRPPEGRYDQNDVDTLTRLGYSVVLWSVDTDDWSGVSKEHIIEAVRSELRGGGIILCHDYLTEKCHTVEALRVIIPELLAEGYEFVTVSQLLDISKQ